MPSVRSLLSTTRPGSTGRVKLGQPVPESNLSRRAEQRLAGDDVDVEAGAVVVPELVVERRLGPVLLRDLVLHRTQLPAQNVVGGLGVGLLGQHRRPRPVRLLVRPALGRRAAAAARKHPEREQ